MQKLFSALLLIFVAFSSKDLMSQEAVHACPLAKGRPRLPVLKEHGKLYFEFGILTSNSRIDQPTTPTGTWQTFVITPDKRRYNGPVIDITSEPQVFRIRVEPPILYGTYTVVVNNINVQNTDGTPFIGPFLEPGVIVTNTFNQKLLTFEIESLQWQNDDNLANLPNHAVQGFVVLPPNFIRD